MSQLPSDIRTPLEVLSNIRSVAQLAFQLGDITAEERETLQSIDFDADPTPKELEALGPGFTQRVIDRTLPRLPIPLDVPRHKEPFWRLQSSVLLEIIQDMEDGTLLQDDTGRELAQQLADAYARRLAQICG